jgi:nucleotide-binding universal stress UspA family protein
VTIKELFLVLPTYPDAPPEQALESAVFLARFLGARITASVPQLNSDPKTWPPSLGAWPVDLVGLMQEAVLQSERNAQHLADRLGKLAAQFEVPLDLRRNLTSLYATPKPTIDLARLHDMTIMSVPETADRGYVEAVLFDTGRATLLLPSSSNSKPLRKLETVLVAWDFSREAARALGDALPILARARRVHILSILGEKGIDTSCVPSDLGKYLEAHKVRYVLDERVLKDGSVGELISSCAAEFGADMIVMGAYGHSRLREFVLGGATAGMLSDPPLPVFLSH